MKVIIVICLVVALSMGPTEAQEPKDKEEFRQLINIFRGNGTDDENGSSFSIVRMLRNLFGGGEDDGEGSGSFILNILRNLFRGGDDEGDGKGFGSSIINFFRSLRNLFRRGGGGGGTEESDAEVLSSLRMPGTARGFDVSTLSAVKIIQALQERLRGDDGFSFENTRQFFLEIYGEMCCANNCKENARTCMDAIKPPMEFISYYEECIPVVFNSIREQQSIMPVVVDCAMSKILLAMGLPYTPGDLKTNAETYLNATVLNNTDLKGAGSKILDSVKDGVCIPPAMEDSKITDHFKFKMCILNTCVNAMAA